eukprot:COSAG06_NODE_44485_length_363_cov_0.666667_1_plen_25_part_10
MISDRGNAFNPRVGKSTKRRSILIY